MDYFRLDTLRRAHPAWRLLAADHAPLIASFLHVCFVAPNVRTLSQVELVSKLDDYLHHLRERLGEGYFPRSAAAYIDEWAADDHGWLRKYYPPGSDEPHFDLTPATEKAIEWLASLQQRHFVATESRLMTVFELLRQMCEGTEGDPKARIAELERRRVLLDAEIQRVERGHVDLLDPAQVKDRFLQMASTARALLSDFREVEQNFRDLDRSVRERIATWEGSKGALLSELFAERDVISDSDQGKSFRAFWDFLIARSRVAGYPSTPRIATHSESHEFTVCRSPPAPPSADKKHGDGDRGLRPPNQIQKHPEPEQSSRLRRPFRGPDDGVHPWGGFWLASRADPFRSESGRLPRRLPSCSPATSRSGSSSVNNQYSPWSSGSEQARTYSPCKTHCRSCSFRGTESCQGRCRSC